MEVNKYQALDDAIREHIRAGRGQPTNSSALEALARPLLATNRTPFPEAWRLIDRRMQAMRKAGRWVDLLRLNVPAEQKIYTWWSYRNRDWKVSNRGRRLDHIWTTKPLLPKLKKHTIHQIARDFEKPSDHVPVMIELDL